MYNALRETIRQLWRGRSRAAAIVTVMALGIGSCVTVFSMISAVLLAEWPYADPDRLAIVWHARAKTPGVIGMSASDVETYRASLRTFDRAAAVTTRGYNAGSNAPVRVTCARMSADMFPMLGVPAQRGRWFTAEEDRRREAVVVISDRMWRAQLGGDLAFPGADLLLDAVPHRVIGIMPESFAFPPEGVQGLSPAECWVPASYTSAELAAPSFNFVLFGRLDRGITIAQAAADANAVARKIWSEYPAAIQSQIDLEARVRPLSEQVLAGSRTPMYVFAAAAVLLLLIACANVTNLLFTAVDARRNDLAVRASLGASRRRLVSQLLMESITLSIAGGVLGAALAFGLIAAIVAVSAAAFPRLASARLDLAALAFGVACSTFAGILGGLAPAWRLRSTPLVTERAASRSFARQPWRRVVIAFEMALAVLVLVVAVAGARSVLRLNAIDPGFAPEQLLTFSVAMPPAQYAQAEQTMSFATEALRRLEGTAGITAAAAGTALPIGPAAATVLTPAGDGASPPKYQPAALNAITADYARAAGLIVRQGRFIERHDGASMPRVAVVNETLARTLWPADDAVGRSIVAVGDPSPLTVVGVVADVRQGGPLRAAAPALYVPLTQSASPAATLHFIVRSQMGADRLATLAREIVGGLDRSLPTFALRTGDDLIAGTISAHRFNLLILTVFAAIAVLLALAGVYGVLSHFVEQSRRSLGIRQALGATAARIIAAIVGWALVPVLAGIVAGVIAASGALALMSSLFFEVSPGDPRALAAVAAAVAGAAIATVLPSAIGASKINVAALLRRE